MAVMAVVLSLVAGMLWFAAASPVARAAGSNVSPDPAPQAAPTASGGSPAPDPAPQPTPAASAIQSAPASQSASPVIPHPTASGIAVAPSPPVSRASSTVPAAAAPIQPSAPVRRTARRSVHRVRRPAAWVAEAAHQVTTPWRQNPLLAGAAARSAASATAPRGGVLLLLGSAALAVLALASASMLRLLHRMERVRPS